jgi:uncharacterized coiled-coil protein SlyX
MANRLLNGIAVAAGRSLAIGITSGRVLVRPPREVPALRTPAVASPSGKAIPSVAVRDEVLDLEPLLDRLERMEARIEFAGQQAPAARRYAALFADLERHVGENSRELALLRERTGDAEKSAAEAAASAQKAAGRTREEIPDLVEKIVAARLDELQNRFTAEIEQSRRLTLETLDRTLDEKLAARIGSLERTLAAQAGSIASLVLRAADTDNNMQRLVAAVDRLCQRVETTVPIPSEARSPFEPDLRDVLHGESVEPVTIDARASAVEPPPAAGLAVASPPSPAKGAAPRLLFTAVPDPAPRKARFPFFR